METLAVMSVIFGAYVTIWLCITQWCITQKAIAEYQADLLLHMSELQAGIADAQDPTMEHEPESMGRRISLVPREEN